MNAKTVTVMVGERPHLTEATIKTITAPIRGDFWQALPVEEMEHLPYYSAPAGIVAVINIPGWEVSRAVPIPEAATEAEAQKIIVATANRVWRMISS
jgi:hypothetical protein